MDDSALTAQVTLSGRLATSDPPARATEGGS